MYFGHLLLLCAFLWCLFHIPFPEPMPVKRRFFLCVSFLAMFFLQKYSINTVSEVYLNPTSALFFLGALGMAYWKDTNRLFSATFVSILLGVILAFAKEMLPWVDAGVLLGVFCAVFAQIFWKQAESAVFCAAAAPVFAAGIVFGLEWSRIGYSVFEFLTQPLFDAQITGGLLAYLLSHSLQRRVKFANQPNRVLDKARK